MQSQLKTYSLVLVLSEIWGGTAMADVLFLAHYDTAKNADFAAGSATERNRGSGSISADGGAIAGQAAVALANKSMSYNLAGNLSATSGSVMLWAKVDTYGGSGGTGQSAWFSVGTSGAYNTPATTDIYLRGNAWNTATLTISDGAHSYDLKTTATPSQATWSNYAFTWNVNANNTIDLALYVNGTSVASLSSVVWNGFHFSNTGNTDIDNVFYVGGVQSYMAPNAYGKVDEVAITNDAKTASQIKALYDLQTGGGARELTASDLQTATVPEPASLSVLAGTAISMLLMRTKIRYGK